MQKRVLLSGLGEGTSAAPEGVLVVLPCSRALRVRPQVCSRVAFQLTCSRLGTARLKSQGHDHRGQLSGLCFGL